MFGNVPGQSLWKVWFCPELHDRRCLEAGKDGRTAVWKTHWDYEVPYILKPTNFFKSELKQLCSDGKLFNFGSQSPQAEERPCGFAGSQLRRKAPSETPFPKKIFQDLWTVWILNVRNMSGFTVATVSFLILHIYMILMICNNRDIAYSFLLQAETKCAMLCC